jgi:hypothetical protein
VSWRALLDEARRDHDGDLTAEVAG